MTDNLTKCYDELDGAIKTALDRYDKELKAIRTGRVSSGLLAGVSVSYNEQQFKVEHLARVSVLSASVLIVEPWDPGSVEAVVKGIQTANLGVNPSIDGARIKLTFPPISSERRKELSKLVSKCAEDARISLRNLRRVAIEQVRKLDKNGECSKDDAARMQKQIQKLLDTSTDKIAEMAASKEKELLQQ